MKKTVKVYALGDGTDGVECQVASHNCQGIFHCPFIKPSLLEDVERYEPDSKEVEALAADACMQNVDQTSSVEAVTLLCVTYSGLGDVRC